MLNYFNFILEKDYYGHDEESRSREVQNQGYLQDIRYIQVDPFQVGERGPDYRCREGLERMEALPPEEPERNRTDNEAKAVGTGRGF